MQEVFSGVAGATSSRRAASDSAVEKDDRVLISEVLRSTCILSGVSPGSLPGIEVLHLLSELFCFQITASKSQT